MPEEVLFVGSEVRRLKLALLAEKYLESPFVGFELREREIFSPRTGQWGYVGVAKDIKAACVMLELPDRATILCGPTSSVAKEEMNEFLGKISKWLDENVDDERLRELMRKALEDMLGVRLPVAQAQKIRS